MFVELTSPSWRYRVALSLTFIVCLVCQAGSVGAWQDNEKKPPAKNPIAVGTRDLKIVDAGGMPVGGVRVDGWLLNEKFFWQSDLLPRVPAISDKDGLAKLEYPKSLGADLVIESVKCTVSHVDFLQKEIVVPVLGKKEEPFEIKLEPGIELTIRAIDEEGKPIKSPYAVMMSRVQAVIPWKRPAPDVVQCRSLQDGMSQIMLVQPKPDGKHLFSDVTLQAFNKASQPSVELKGVELLPGTKLKGKLSDQVPRPVKEGWVTCVSIPLPAGDSWDQKLPSLLYYSGVKIEADGTFEFPSLPSSGTVQLLATCDGWVGLQDKTQPFVVGETFEVEDTSQDIVLQMEATFDAKIRIIDSNGQPVEGVSVHCSPNQLFRKGGSTLLGERFSSSDTIDAQVSDEVKPARDVNMGRYSAVSDAQGMVTIRNLPRNRLSTSFAVIPTQKAKRKYLTNDRATGKLPGESEITVEFDITIEEDK
ncbi:MAG: hypothetical protein U0930_14330 [Pirellulales bacterium]